ncbi:hypothetical protein NKI77_07980 [Mesorhizobium opportunistum]|uniref:Uncharacterized protein n=1 Tax=Mesorhizobium opportunistum TaxID=593909 RepID=A0ABV1YBM0_9HYPH|nr:hypothetical protein [Mesorhizobium sp.]
MSKIHASVFLSLADADALQQSSAENGAGKSSQVVGVREPQCLIPDDTFMIAFRRR